MAGIGHPWTFECQGLSVTEGANPLKMEFFDVVARLEFGLARLNDTLDQSGSAVGHRWLLLLILDSWREQKFADPWWLDVHVHQDPLLLGTLPAALEGSLDIFNPMMAS
jgi:hypothetical protein